LEAALAEPMPGGLQKIRVGSPPGVLWLDAETCERDRPQLIERYRIPALKRL